MQFILGSVIISKFGMKKRALLCTVCLLCSLLAIGQTIMKNSLVGVWKQEYSLTSYSVYTASGIFTLFLNDIDVYGSEGKPSYYGIKNVNDTSWLLLNHKRINISGKFVNNSHEKEVIWLDGDVITRITYKKGEGINSHIDEYSRLYRANVMPPKKNMAPPRIIYILPPHFKGAAWIAFNQVDGVQPTYDSLGVPMLTIPDNGILRTSLREDSYGTANGLYSISLKDASAPSGLQSYKVYDKLDPVDSTCCKADELIAIMCGFNQTSRPAINTIFGMPIVGNVMTIYIGYFSQFDKHRYSLGDNIY